MPRPSAASTPTWPGLLSGRVVVGHNVDRFDLAFLLAECRRLGGEDLVPPTVVTLDTLRVAQSYLDLPGKARLVDCCDRYRLTWDDHHSALGDARVTAALLRCHADPNWVTTCSTSTGSCEAGSALAWPGWSEVRPVAQLRRHTPAA